MAKPFFYRITAADFVRASMSIPEAERAVWTFQLGMDMLSGDADEAVTEFGKQIIRETNEFRAKKAQAGSAGGRKKADNSNPEKYGKTRTVRMAHARSIATHTKEEWEAMKAIFDHLCVICGCEVEGNTPTKDHVIPVSRGGSDGIDNIQPSCRACNVSKGNNAGDYRFAGWKQTLSKHLANTYPLTEAVTVSITEPLTEESKVKTLCAIDIARRKEMFEEFWNSFEYKKGKGDAEKSWKKIKLTEPLFLTIIKGAKREAVNRPALKAKNGTPKMAQGWLTGKRWEDDHEETTAQPIQTQRKPQASDVMLEKLRRLTDGQGNASNGDNDGSDETIPLEIELRPPS